MRYLLISFCFFFVGCASYPENNNFIKREISDLVLKNTYFSDKQKDYIYKATINVNDKPFGGVFIVKKIRNNNHRVVFTTEMGNKIFDFSFINEDFRVNYILEDLNKKILINILKKDFKVLIEESPLFLNAFSSNNYAVFETKIYDKRHYYYTISNQIHKIVRSGKGKEKVIFTFKNTDNFIANLIKIEHKNLKLTINLKSI
ncbi:hypothetical protein [Aquimarina muelleri]|uniref:Lipoprotein n=1 Tax=Aquimarina muelleri TaxID=279356 RepID=A0A918JWT7_9FLAO|nr:hypothetical protein [Aquimarina muelleri]MCX2762009.1 hypothetical protein [Aquimarina muelleri]GGX25040.1 hypothetical protein GCM10007384_27650 [Aquimarina muelleri]